MDYGLEFEIDEIIDKASKDMLDCVREGKYDEARYYAGCIDACEKIKDIKLDAKAKDFVDDFVSNLIKEIDNNNEEKEEI